MTDPGTPTAGTIISGALKLLGVLAAGETAPSDDSADGLAVLQDMLRAWSGQGIHVWSLVEESQNTTASQASYTWGASGNWTSVRPHQITNLYVRDSDNNDFPIDLITRNKYQGITLKTTTGRPDRAYYAPEYPQGKLYLYPTPDATYAVKLTSVKPFTETSSFDSTSSTLVVPPHYIEPIKFNLAIRLAPTYGKQLTAETVAIAREGYNALIANNFDSQLEPVCLDIMTTGRDANIEAG